MWNSCFEMIMIKWAMFYFNNWITCYSWFCSAYGLIHPCQNSYDTHGIIFKYLMQNLIHFFYKFMLVALSYVYLLQPCLVLYSDLFPVSTWLQTIIPILYILLRCASHAPYAVKVHILALTSSGAIAGDIGVKISSSGRTIMTQIQLLMANKRRT